MTVSMISRKQTFCSYDEFISDLNSIWTKELDLIQFCYCKNALDKIYEASRGEFFAEIHKVSDSFLQYVTIKCLIEECKEKFFDVNILTNSDIEWLIDLKEKAKSLRSFLPVLGKRGGCSDRGVFLLSNKNDLDIKWIAYEYLTTNIRHKYDEIKINDGKIIYDVTAVSVLVREKNNSSYMFLIPVDVFLPDQIKIIANQDLCSPYSIDECKEKAKLVYSIFVELGTKWK